MRPRVHEIRARNATGVDIVAQATRYAGGMSSLRA